MNRLLLTLLLCLAWLGTPLSAKPERVDRFTDFANKLLDDKALRGTSWSIMVSSLTTGEIIYERDPDRMLVPASVAKLTTSAAAMATLGPDHRFTTPVAVTGSLKDGVLSGNLILRAGGDPTAETKPVLPFGIPLLQIWADSLKAHGLREVDGDLVLATSPYLYEAATPTWELDDLNGGFAPAVDGFGYNSNVCFVTVLPASSEGRPALFSVDPPFAPLAVELSVITGPADRPASLGIHVAPRDTSVLIYGTIPLGDDGEYFWVPVQNPALYFGRAFRAALAARGITVKGEVRIDRSANAIRTGRVLWTYRSVPLTEILTVMNKASDNYLAEYMLRAVGLHHHGTASRYAGLQGVNEFLAGLGIDTRDFYVEDGSGLSRHNLASARSVTQLLWFMSTAPYGEAFRRTLAIAGQDGTLGGRLGEPQYRGRMIGKTGTMTRISGLAGYVTTNRGEVLSLAILCNNFRTSLPYVRATQDRLVERLIAGWHEAN